MNHKVSRRGLQGGDGFCVHIRQVLQGSPTLYNRRRVVIIASGSNNENHHTREAMCAPGELELGYLLTFFGEDEVLLAYV